MEKSKAVILRTLGLMIREQRAALGISQEELGLRCHLDRTYISGLERGVRNPSLTALVTLAKGLNITVSQLLENLEIEIEKPE
ncbi:MAG: helix-turn-helix domain-containing protein [Microcystis sp.]|jgi:transcriptional regulator with XRE-family HTH domain|uniref:Helix-turn-helix transcriptional regulator n=1 Tax=Microcystis aeruginosa G11-04 TaxID=2685956 RepID=A0A966L5A2_MICAE|nr:helix-turn-helix transcriptional regulator [Microcystis aeruginosa SX13-11]NCR25998.1 helix-turn-helix transcriptional regulator [Microcystis aeruginosa LE13-04]NCS21242.1 helix-turn-helix transcriptional regulator [Microcystis aeruginosa G11-06]NCS38934.1 helix-turn-helix transcriptional regulator [Microcystis aeruginosa BS13-10]NCS56514.1 helix-turn-helix transcriptional regulator [Microcystis aeruginosa G11-04]NCT42833.1 helix-turn-helix transcriptional regulator [Microcystis aeruginosa 